MFNRMTEQQKRSYPGAKSIPLTNLAQLKQHLFYTP
jgi:hypothetical protein